MAYISVKGLLQLLGLPIRLLWTVVKFYTVGTGFRKYGNRLLNCLKLIVFRTALSLDVPDTKVLAVLSNSIIIHRLLPFKYNSITSKLPGYGTKYDAKSYWLVKQPNRTSLDPILIYLHGGGYFLQTQPLQLESLLAIYKLISPAKQRNLSILFLDYSLACFENSSLPLQVDELHETYMKLTQIDGNTNVILMGDSAGGNLSILYCQHLKTLAQRQLSPPIYPSSLILISPWVRLVPEPYQFKPGNSYYDNDRFDMLMYTFLTNHRSQRYLFGPNDLEKVSPNLKADCHIQDWQDIPTFGDATSHVLVLVGEDEVFRDDVLQFSEYALGCPLYSEKKYGFSEGKFDPSLHEYIRKGVPGQCGLQVYVEPWGVHDSLFFFENHTLSEVQRAENTNNMRLSASLLSDNDHFGIKRVVNFLDKIL